MAAAGLSGTINNGVYAVGGAGDITLSGQLGTTGAANTLTKVGGNVLTIGGTLDNVSLGVIAGGGTVILAKASSPGVHAVGIGGLTINAGALVQLGGSGGDQIFDGGGPEVTDNLGGTLDLAGKAETVNLLNGAGTVTSSGTGGITTVSGGGTLSRSHHGRRNFALTVTGGTNSPGSSNTYSGATTISSGVLQVGITNGTSPNSAVTDNATLDLGGFGADPRPHRQRHRHQRRQQRAAVISGGTFGGSIQNGTAPTALTVSGGSLTVIRFQSLRRRDFGHCRRP